jgi:hypothetical protein
MAILIIGNRNISNIWIAKLLEMVDGLMCGITNQVVKNKETSP